MSQQQCKQCQQSQSNCQNCQQCNNHKVRGINWYAALGLLMCLASAFLMSFILIQLFLFIRSLI